MYYSAYVGVELRKTDQPFELVAYLEPPRPRRSCFGQDQAITLASRGLALAIERPDRFALAMLVGDLSRTRAGAPRLSRPMRGHPLRRRQRRPVSFADGPRRVQLIIARLVWPEGCVVPARPTNPADCGLKSNNLLSEASAMER